MLAANPKVKIEEGELEGIKETSEEGKEYYVFKGVPYAEPPIGNLRFKAPVPKKPWTGVRDATKNGGFCGQINLMNGSSCGSDDCLYLTIHTPEIPPDGAEDKLLPVMLYIHGGGFVMGAGTVEQCFIQFSSDFIVAKNTVMVSINYRLGVLGFLCLDTPDVPGNAGLKDQNLALKWVKNNIKAFGGDPNNITIFGISAGSASVEYHLISPLSKGLFNKAILQSGSTLNPWARSKSPLKLANLLANELGIKSSDPEDILQGLQNIEVNELVKKAHLLNDSVFAEGELFTFTPVVEKIFPGVIYFITEDPIVSLSSGRYTRVPTISGLCANEGGVFKMHYGKYINDLMERKFIDYVPPSFVLNKEELDAKLKKTYGTLEDIDAIDAFLSDVHMNGGIFQSQVYRMKDNPLNNYFYLFNYRGGLNGSAVMVNVNTGPAYHADDTFYLGSGTLVKDVVPSPEDILTRSRMVQMWTDFAKYGNPTPETSALVPIKWIPATSDNQVMLDIGQDLEIKEFPFQERNSLWGSLYEIVRKQNIK